MGKATFPIIGRRPFLYTGGTLLDLNNPLPPDPGWELTNALGISDSGQMVGYGYHAGHINAFLLTPQ